MSKETGGSAFPVQELRRADDQIYQWGETGMTLRDYFAAQMIPAILQMIAHGEHGLTEGEHPAVSAARDAYEVADTMLAERDKKGAA